MIQVKKQFELSGHAGPIYGFCEGRKPGSLLTASGDRFVAEWNLSQAEASPFSVKMDEAVFAVHCIMNDQILIAGTGNGHLHVIDLAAGKEIKNLKVHSKGIFSILPVLDENLIVIAGGDGFLSCWEPGSWKLLRHFQVSSSKLREVTRIDDKIYVGGSDGMIRVFDLPWLNELNAFNAHEDGVYSIAKHPHKPLLVSGGKDGHIRFWHINEHFRPVFAIPAHNFGIYSIVFSPDHRFAASASRDKSIKIWDTELFEPRARLIRPAFPMHTHSVNWLFWHPNGLLLSGGDDRKIMAWNVLETQSEAELS